MSNIKIKVFLFSILSLVALHLLTYYPYGIYAHNLAVFSATFVFLSIYKALFEKQIEYIYLTPYILLSWLYFQSPFLLKERTFYYTRVIKDEYINEIALYTSLSVVLIYFGYTFFFKRNIKPLVSRSFRFNLLELKTVSIYFLIFGVLYRLGSWLLPSVVNSLSNLIQLLFYAPTIAFALYVLYLIRSKSKPKFDVYHITMISFIVAEFLIRLSTTLMAQVGVLFLGVFIVYYREKGRLPIVWLLAILFIGVPLYQSRKYFRNQIYNQSIDSSPLEFGYTMVSKVFLEEESQITTQADELDKYIMKHEESKHNRFENLSFISHVVWQHKTSQKDFLYGETFYWLPLVPIPRIIFPLKPENKMGSETSTSYGLRAKNSKASINFPMLVEGYINFGFNGMLVMALLFGMAYKWFVMKFGAGVGDLNLIMIINASKQFTHAEGNITLVFGALIQVFVFWWVLVKVFNLGKVNESKE